MTAEVFAGYRLEERIGIGGMAEVYRATRLGPGGFAKQVALKRVLPDLARDPELVAMFLDEARLAAQLSAPGLVQVFDFGEAAGSYYLVMEYVDGIDLAELLAASGPLPPALAVHLGRRLCMALGELHQARDARGEALGIVHRDVSPGNILVSVDGHIKLGDFGVAKARARGVRTERGALKGKLAYLTPEQVRGEDVDGRTDLYALALVIFEALVGVRYLEAPREHDLLRAAERPVFRAPSSLRAGLPAALDVVLARALEPEPVSRFPTPAFFDQALAGCVPALDEAEARRQLGALVRAARGRAERASEQAVLGDAPSGDGGGRREDGRDVAGVVDAPRRTEVLPAPSPPRPRRAVRWRRAAAWAGALAALGVAGVLGARVLGWRGLRATRAGGEVAAGFVGPRSPLAPPSKAGMRSPEQREGVGGARSEAASPNTKAGVASERAAGGEASAEALKLARIQAPSLAASRGQRPSAGRPAGEGGRTLGGTPESASSRAGPAARADIVAAAPPPDGRSASGPALPSIPPPPTPPAADSVAARARLEEVGRLLERRGLRISDAPQLHAARRALAAKAARGELSEADAAELWSAVQAFPMDRAFIDAKLRRLSREMAGRELAPEVRQRLRRHSQQALSESVNGRYDQANRELNEIAATLER